AQARSTVEIHPNNEYGAILIQSEQMPGQVGDEAQSFYLGLNVPEEASSPIAFKKVLRAPDNAFVIDCTYIQPFAHTSCAIDINQGPYAVISAKDEILRLEMTGSEAKYYSAFFKQGPHGYYIFEAADKKAALYSSVEKFI